MYTVFSLYRNVTFFLFSTSLNIAYSYYHSYYNMCSTAWFNLMLYGMLITKLCILY